MRASVIVPKESLDKTLEKIVEKLEKLGYSPEITLKEKETGYKGVHINFVRDRIPQEIQLHTRQSYTIKQVLHKNYKQLRGDNGKLSQKEFLKLLQKSQTIARIKFTLQILHRF